jgi:hypothetical protein
VSTTAVVFLGVIAVATLAATVIQILQALAIVRLARRIEAVAETVDREIRPLIAHTTAVAAHAARVSEVTVAQVERADRLFADLARRVDDVARMVQGTLLAPAREGRALLAALAAAFGAVREGRLSREASSAADEDDPLFIG